MTAQAQAKFANVDIDIKTTSDPALFVQAISRFLLATHTGKDGRKHWVRFSFTDPRSPAHAIRRFARVLAKLPKPVQRVWKDAASREFDIGIEAGNDPKPGEWVLDEKVIGEIHRLNGQVRITIYRPRSEC
jgi:hypothetical protein